MIRAALSGVLSAAAGVAAAELVAAGLDRPAAAPVFAVGGTVIDATPTPLKEFAVRTVGTYDKPLLLAGIGLGLVVIAAVIGVLARRRPFVALLGAVAFGVVGIAAAVTRPTSQPVDVLPSLAGALVMGAALVWTLRPAVSPPGVQSKELTSARVSPPGVQSKAQSRRSFLGRAGVVALGAAAFGAGAFGIGRVRSGAAARARDAVTLPPPADPAPPLPAGVGPAFYTRNADFYRVDTALTVPAPDVDGWRLKITGMVDRPVELSFEDLLKRGLTERDITLNCVSNEVGGPYIGTARWLGVPLGQILREAGVQGGADQVVARGSDGMTIGTPVTTVLDTADAMLVVGMNGEPLPAVHGFPVRMLTPGLYGYAGSCKWITELELSRFDRFDAYWVERGWAPRGPVKTASRIDRPAAFAKVPAGTVAVAGVAWAQGRGISAVQVEVDGGGWQEARLLPTASNDTWTQWVYDWRATAGAHSIRVRAVDGRGDVQSGERATPFPSGATGWQTIAVTVT